MMMSTRRKANSGNPANRVSEAPVKTVKKKVPRWTMQQLTVLVGILIVFVLVATMSIVTAL